MYIFSNTVLHCICLSKKSENE